MSALIVWATPRLARRCGVAEVSALWLGAANPLLFMHLVAGIHNEALMLGLMLAGTEFALRGVDAAGRLLPRPLAWPRGRAEWARWWPLAMLITGTVLITMSSQVKLPSLLALGFVAMALARRWGGTLRAFLVAGGSLTAVSLAVMAVIGWASGLGFGWVFTLGTANVVRSWMSLPTLLALGTGQVGILLGSGRPHHRGAGADPRDRCAHHRGARDLAAAGRAARPPASGRRARCRAGRHGAAVPGGAAVVPAVGDHPAGGVGHPARDSARAAIAVTLVVGIFGPTANGDRFALFQIVLATAGQHAHRGAAHRADLLPAAVAEAARRRPRCGRTGAGAVAVEPALPRPQAAKPDAYAESP